MLFIANYYKILILLLKKRLKFFKIDYLELNNYI